jgi:hypothetical protein
MILHCGRRGYVGPPAILTTNKNFFKISIFWDMTQSSLFKVNRRFGEEQDKQENRVKADGKQRHVLPKLRLTFKGLHGAISQNSS